MKAHHIIKIIAFGLFAGAAVAQNIDLPYSSGSTGVDGPFTVPEKGGGAYKFGFAYDAERQEAVKFGGINNGVSGAVTAETWVFNGRSWLQKNPAASPSARRGCAMAYDAIRKRVLMFGGETAAAVKNAETWLWDGTTWNPATPSVSPSARSLATAAWDPIRAKIVLFGGRDAVGLKQDTWLWNGTDWESVDPPAKPAPRESAGMTYYPSTQSVVLISGELSPNAGVRTYGTDIWSWDGQNWSLLGTLPAGTPGRTGGSLVYDPVHDELLLHGGETSTVSFQSIGTLVAWRQAGAWVAKVSCPKVAAHHAAVWHAAAGEMVVGYGLGTSGAMRDETWAWDGYDWITRTGSTFMFDLRSKPEAIWHFTDINIPAGYRVQFRRNGANNPVMWLASEGVVINGIVDVNGGNGVTGNSAERPRGGPGGFDGGQGGNWSILSEAGRGPGAGTPGVSAAGGPGRHATSLTTGAYGSAFAQPLIGGSGGGGGGWAGAPQIGGQGGGGGGVLLIASSRDITVNGSIEAAGGSGGLDSGGGNSYRGGAGSGGTVRLVADRITCTSGTINAGSSGDGKGRVRLEGLLRQVDPARVTGVYSASVPVAGSVLNQAGGRLTFTKVAGANVANPPRGDTFYPDVIFTAEGEVAIEVQAQNIPDGTPVTVTINHSIAGVINLPAAGQVTLQQGKAVFTATIPAGQGVMQAFATYNVGGPPPSP